MEINEYQEKALKTAIYDRDKFALIYPTLGLCGEAGELAEKVKKQIRDNDADFLDTSFRQAVKKEAGDVAWYLSAISSDLGFSLEEVFQENLDKLQSRKERNKLHGSGDDR